MKEWVPQQLRRIQMALKFFRELVKFVDHDNNWSSMEQRVEDRSYPQLWHWCRQCSFCTKFIFMWVGYPLVIMCTGMYYSAALSCKQSLRSCKCWNDTQFNPLNAPISLLDENISHNVWPGSVLHKLKDAYLKQSTAAPTVKDQANLHWYNLSNKLGEADLKIKYSTMKGQLLPLDQFHPSLVCGPATIFLTFKISYLFFPNLTQKTETSTAKGGRLY